MSLPVYAPWGDLPSGHNSALATADLPPARHNWAQLGDRRAASSARTTRRRPDACLGGCSVKGPTLFSPQAVPSSRWPTGATGTRKACGESFRSGRHCLVLSGHGRSYSDSMRPAVELHRTVTPGHFDSRIRLWASGSEYARCSLNLRGELSHTARHTGGASYISAAGLLPSVPDRNGSACLSYIEAPGRGARDTIRQHTSNPHTKGDRPWAMTEKTARSSTRRSTRTPRAAASGAAGIPASAAAAHRRHRARERVRLLRSATSVGRSARAYMTKQQ